MIEEKFSRDYIIAQKEVQNIMKSILPCMEIDLKNI